MNHIEPLKSSIGSPAEGKNKFFARDKIVKKINRKLSNGEHLLLSAPRRIGKSSIIKYINNHPQANQLTKYLIVQSVDSSEEFFKKLFNELISDKEILSGLDGYLARTTNAVKRYASRISSVTLDGSIEINQEEKIDYYHECIQLIKGFDNKEKQLIIFIDEFPDALNNILEKDKNGAIRFLQQNRDLRIQFSNTNLQFVYTGSTGLKNIVRKLDKLDLVNDIKEIIIPPFAIEEAKHLIQRLIAGFKEENSEFHLNEETIDYILHKVTWRIPYYMQIILDELFEYFDDTEKAIDENGVDFVLSEIVKSKSCHSDYFENWKRRLKNAFQHQDYAFAIEVLNYIAKNNMIEYAVFCDLSVKNEVEDHHYILSVLEHDGYISENEQSYGFNSILLKEWWYINVAT